MDKKNENNKPIKASIGYTVGNYCLKGIGLITIPIFSRLMTTADFGTYNTFLAYESILYIIMCLALHGSLKNALYRYDKKFSNYVTSIAIIPLLMFFLFFMISVIFNNRLSKILGINSNILQLLVIYSYCTGLVIYYQTILSLDYNFKEYLKLSFFNVIFSVFISIILMVTVFSERRYIGRVIGGTLSYLIIAIYIWYRMVKKAYPKYNVDYWKYGLKIGVPLISHGLSQIILLQFDRIMINKMIGSSQAGIYSFAYTIYTLVQITTNSLDTVYSTWVFKKIHENDLDNIRKVATLFTLFIAGICTGVMLLSPEIIFVLGGSKYKESVICTIPVILGGFFAMAYVIPSVIEYYYEKTKYISFGTSIAMVINVVLNYICIPRYGYVSASYTTLFSYVVYFCIHIVISKKLCGQYLIKMHYLFATVFILLVAFISSFLFLDDFFKRLLILTGLITIGFYLITRVYGWKNLKHILQRKN